MDGTVLRFGELKTTGAMIEQVKGFSYSVSSLLGANSILPLMAEKSTGKENINHKSLPREKNKKSWWKISLASPKIQNPVLGW